MVAEPGFFDSFVEALTFAGIGGGGVTLLGLYYGRGSALGSRRDRIEQDLKINPEYREEILRTLTISQAAAFYQRALGRALDWADRVFGPSNQPYALAWSLWVALIYSWVLFWGICGAGGSCQVLTVPMFDTDATLADTRVAALILTLGLGVLGFALYWIGKRIGRWERSRTVQRQRRGQRLWPRRLPLACVFGFSTLAISFGLLGPSSETISSLISVLALLAAGAIYGVFLSRFTPIHWLSVFLAGAGTLAVAGVLGGSIAFVLAAARAPIGGGALLFLGVAGFLAAPFVVTAALAASRAGTLAMAITIAVPLTLILSAHLTIAQAGPLAGAGAIAGAVTLGFLQTGLPRKERDGKNRGLPPIAAWSTILVWGVVAFYLFGGSKDFIVLVCFFLLLPLANGALDWLSWWISRWLGADLRRELSGLAPKRSMVLTICKHAAIDLAAAIGLLLVLALVLGFGFGAAEHGEIAEPQARGLPLSETIQAAAQHPWDIGNQLSADDPDYKPGGLWFTLMLVSTLIPTAIHFLFLLASPLALVQAGKQNRMRLHAQLVPLSWDQMSPDERDTLANQISRELVQRNALIWGPAAGLFCFLLGGLILAMIALVDQPWFAAVVAWFAEGGVNLAAFFFG